MALFNKSNIRVLQYPSPCFNPCFHGWPSSTKWPSHLQPLQNLFQSLFSWMALFNLVEGAPNTIEAIVSILVFMDGPLQPDRAHISAWLIESFNPCFHGWPSSTAMKRVGNCSYSVFQSLFSWMALFNQGKSGFYSQKIGCFNPCFHGWPSSTILCTTDPQKLIGFNPCFHGWPSST